MIKRKNYRNLESMHIFFAVFFFMKPEKENEIFGYHLSLSSI